MIDPKTDCHCHILPGLDDGMFDFIGTDLHNERYADFFDGFGFRTA